MAAPVEVQGLKELRKALNDLGDVEASREFKDAGYMAMANVLVPGAVARASTPMERRAMATLRSERVATGGAVRFGRGFAGAFGAEFGAVHDVPRPNVNGYPGLGYNQFGPVVRGGRNIFPTVREKAGALVSEFDKGLEPLFRRLFPD